MSLPVGMVFVVHTDLSANAIVHLQMLAAILAVCVTQ